MEPLGIAPRFPACGAGVVLLDHDPKAEAVGVEPTSGTMPPPAFQAGSSTIRMASVSKLRELELNQHDDVQSVASCHWMIPHRFSLETRAMFPEFGEEGSKHSSLNEMA